MTPFRMRLFFVAFSALATATSINALYLQEAPRHVAGVRAITEAQPVKTAAVETPPPAAESAPVQNPPTASISEPEKTAEPVQPAAQPDAQSQQPPQTQPEPQQQTPTVAVHEPVVPPTPRVAPAGPEVLPPPVPLVKSIQRELAARGYAPGRRDGVLSLTTRAAILAYEFDEKTPLTGEPTEAVLKTLIFAKAAGAPKIIGAPASRFEQRSDIVSAVQQMLAQYGYISSPADGQFDDRTREAIRKFESDRGMKHPSGRLTEHVLLEMVIVAGKPLAANG